jgi:NTP pyrophosphatase (non-canonical NTP hydrolase)
MYALIFIVFSIGLLLGICLSAILISRNDKKLDKQPYRPNKERNILGDLRRVNPERCKAFGHTVHDLPITFWATALAGETGELCNLIKKQERGDEGPFTEAIAKEAADIVIYLDLLCYRSDINLQAAIVRKFNEVSDRVKSPIKL